MNRVLLAVIFGICLIIGLLLVVAARAENVISAAGPAAPAQVTRRVDHSERHQRQAHRHHHQERHGIGYGTDGLDTNHIRNLVIAPELGDMAADFLSQWDTQQAREAAPAFHFLDAGFHPITPEWDQDTLTVEDRDIVPVTVRTSSFRKEGDTWTEHQNEVKNVAPVSSPDTTGISQTEWLVLAGCLIMLAVIVLVHPTRLMLDRINLTEDSLQDLMNHLRRKWPSDSLGYGGNRPSSSIEQLASLSRSWSQLTRDAQNLNARTRRFASSSTPSLATR